MPFEVRANYVARYLTLRYEGEVTATERLEAIDHVASTGATLGFRRVFIDFRGATCAMEGFSARNSVAARLARATGGQNWRLAYLTEPESPLHQDVARLAEARHVPFKCFKHQLPAMAWLLDKRQQ